LGAGYQNISHIVWDLPVLAHILTGSDLHWCWHPQCGLGWSRPQAVAEMAPISSAFEARWSRAVSDVVSWEFESQKHPPSMPISLQSAHSNVNIFEDLWTLRCLQGWKSFDPSFPAGNDNLVEVAVQRWMKSWNFWVLELICLATFPWNVLGNL
jgi:hypothetical protein